MMRKATAIGTALASFLVIALGFGAAVALTAAAAETVVTETFTNVVTYTIPTETETTTEVSTVTETVTETVTTPPPTTTTPTTTTSTTTTAPTVTCTIANAITNGPEICYGAGATQIVRTDSNDMLNSGWACNAPIASYGALPIEVTVTLDNSNPGADADDGIRLANGCTGTGIADLNKPPDLIVHIIGNGGNVGPANDAIKGGGPVGLSIVGEFECGVLAAGAHQDGWQTQGGSNVIAVLRSGSPPPNPSWTCAGAGGGFFDSGAGSNIVCEGCSISARGVGIRAVSAGNGARNGVFTSWEAAPCVFGASSVNVANVCNNLPSPAPPPG